MCYYKYIWLFWTGGTMEQRTDIIAQKATWLHNFKNVTTQTTWDSMKCTHKMLLVSCLYLGS